MIVNVSLHNQQNKQINQISDGVQPVDGSKVVYLLSFNGETRLLPRASAPLRTFPLVHWFFRSRWSILYIALLLILCAAMVTLFS